MEASLVYSFGDGKCYQLGNGARESHSTPHLIEILEGAEVVKDLVAAGNQTWELRENGRVLAWGTTLSWRADLPREVPLPAHFPPVIQIACGEGNTALLLANGSYVFVDPSQGATELKPIVAKCGDTKLVLTQIAISDKVVLGITDDGKLYDSSLIREGGELYSAPSKFVWVSRAQWYSSAVTEEGEVYTWGMGPLGHEANYQAAPKLVEALRGKRVKKTSCGRLHMAAITRTGQLYTWGSAVNCGVGKKQNTNEPTLVEALASECVVDISCGSSHTAVLTSSGYLYTFGSGKTGCLGLGDGVALEVTPRRVENFDRRAIQIVSCGQNHTCVVAERASRHIKNLAADMGKAVNNPDLFPDLKVFGDWDPASSPPILCHRALFLLRCPAFSETADAETQEFKIPGLRNPRLVAAYVKFMYTDTLAADELTISELLQMCEWLANNAPHMLDAPASAQPIDEGDDGFAKPKSSYGYEVMLACMHRQCIKLLHKALTVHNVFMVLKVSTKRNLLDVKWMCISYVADMFSRQRERERELLMSVARSSRDDLSSEEALPVLASTELDEIWRNIVVNQQLPPNLVLFLSSLTKRPASVELDFSPIWTKLTRISWVVLTSSSTELHDLEEAYSAIWRQYLQKEEIVGVAVPAGAKPAESTLPDNSREPFARALVPSIGFYKPEPAQSFNSSSNTRVYLGKRALGSSLVTAEEKATMQAATRQVQHAEEQLSNSKASISHSLEKMVDNELLSDISFSCVDGGVVRGHKFILCARSAHFLAMFTSGMKESSQAIIEMPDVSKEVLLAMFRYLYTGNVVVTPDNVVDMLSVANLCTLTELQEQCEYIIGRDLETDTAPYVLEMADRLQAKKLKDVALSCMLDSRHSITQTIAFSELSPDLAESFRRSVAHGPHCRLTKEDMSVWHILVQKSYYFKIQACDVYGNNCAEGGETFSIVITKNSSAETNGGAAITSVGSPTVVDNLDGSYGVNLTIYQEGSFSMHILLGSNSDATAIAGSPFQVIVHGQIFPSYSIATLALASQQTEPSPPSPTTVESSISSYTFQAGESVEVTVRSYDGQKQFIPVGDAIFKAILCTPPAEKESAMLSKKFNLLRISGEHEAVFADGGFLKDNKDGTYSLAAKLTRAGEYWLRIVYVAVEHSLWWYSAIDQAVPESVIDIGTGPISLVITPGEPCAATSTSVGKGIGTPVAGVVNTFTVTLRDCSWNPVAISDMRFEVDLFPNEQAPGTAFGLPLDRVPSLESLPKLMDGFDTSMECLAPGTYSISYQYPHVGYYLLSVRFPRQTGEKEQEVSGEAISGSPYAIKLSSFAPSQPKLPNRQTKRKPRTQNKDSEAASTSVNFHDVATFTCENSFEPTDGATLFSATTPVFPIVQKPTETFHFGKE